MHTYKVQSINFHSIGFDVQAIGVRLEIDTDSNEVHGFKIDNESVDLDFNRISLVEFGDDIDFKVLDEDTQNDILNDLIIEMQNL